MTELEKAARQALEVLLDSIDDVRDCLNNILPHAGYARYDRRIEAYREQIAKHEKAIADLNTALRQALEQPAYRAVKTVHEGKPYYVAAHVNEMPKNEHEPAEELQRLRALVRAQQITIDKLEQQPAAPVQVSPLEFVTMVMEKEHLVGKPLFWAEWPNREKNT